MPGRGDPPKEHQFKKGHPPMGGRPKGSLDIKNRIIKMMNEVHEYPNQLSLEKGKKKKAELIEHILDAQAKQALRGNTKAAEFFIERTDGKVANKIEGEMSIPEISQSKQNLKALSTEELETYLALCEKMKAAQKPDAEK